MGVFYMSLMITNNARMNMSRYAFSLCVGMMLQSVAVGLLLLFNALS